MLLKASKVLFSASLSKDRLRGGDYLSMTNLYDIAPLAAAATATATLDSGIFRDLE